LLLLRVAGGVPLQSILASTVIALAVACTAAAAAVMFAAARLGPRPSIISYLVLVAAALGLTWGLDAALAPPLDAAGRRTLTVVTAFNPFLVLDAQLHPGSIAPSADWWSGSPLRSFLLLAGTIFTLCWMSALALAASEGYRATRTDGAPRAPRPIGRFPIAWRESRGRPHAFTADILRWLLAVTMLVGGIVLAFQIETNATIRVLFASLLTTAVVALLAIATLLAASAVARERDDRTLDLLLTTPLQPADYLRGKLLGLIRLLWPPTLAVMVVAATGATLIWAAPPPAEGVVSVVLLPGGLIATGIALPGLLCLGIAIGLSWSVRSRQWTVAAGASLGVTAVAVGGFSLLTLAIYNGLLALGVGLVGGNPLLAPLAAVDPTSWWQANTAIADLNVTMLIGGCVGGVIWFLAALMVLKTTAQSFTMSVRRLAGLD
jgi:ABC-type transport system involved in multi-copper enzyme maturation permease subunit